MLETIVGILLGILAFLGITLLVVLGLVIVLLLLVLFVPIRYAGEFNKDAENMLATVKVSWLLRLVKVFVTYEKELLIKAKVLFFTVYDSTKQPKEKNRKKEKKAAKTKKNTIDEIQGENAEVPNEANGEEAQQSDEANVDCSAADDNLNDTDFQSKDSDLNESQGGESDKKTPFTQKIKAKIENIICKCRSICDKIKSIVQNINYYIEIIKEEETLDLLGRGKMRLFKILKSMRPRKLQADVLVGTGSPDTTGYIMAVAGMLYPTYGKHINIVPDFENTIFEGRICLKGRITIFILLVHGLAVYLDKDLHKLLKKLKREDA